MMTLCTWHSETEARKDRRIIRNKATRVMQGYPGRNGVLADFGHAVDFGAARHLLLPFSILRRFAQPYNDHTSRW